MQKRRPRQASLLLPAVVGACDYQPRGAVSLLEIAVPEA
jgi:hypothetical protein